MTVTDIINNVLAGGMLGAIGQGIRVAVGLKKFNEGNTANAIKGKDPEEFSSSRMVISIFIGFVAGSIGMLVQGGDEIAGTKKNYDTQAIVTIIAIGYSGADFIEGIFNTYINKFKPSGQPVNKPAASTGNNAANEQPTELPDEAGLSNTPAQG